MAGSVLSACLPSVTSAEGGKSASGEARRARIGARRPVTLLRASSAPVLLSALPTQHPTQHLTQHLAQHAVPNSCSTPPQEFKLMERLCAAERIVAERDAEIKELKAARAGAGNIRTGKETPLTTQ